MHFFVKIQNSKLLQISRINFLRAYLRRYSNTNDVTMANNEKKSFKTFNGNISEKTVQIVVTGSGHMGSPPSVCLINGMEQYLINSGEGTSRAGDDIKLALNKISNIFITYPSWKNMSGLIGCVSPLSLFNGTKKIVNVFVPPDVENFFDVLLEIFNMKSLSLNLKPFGKYREILDGKTKIKIVVLDPLSSKSEEKCASDLVEEEGSDYYEIPYNSISKRGRYDIGSNNKEEVTINSESGLKKQAYCYIFETPSHEGTLLIKKCVEFGVTPGPLLGELKKGNDIVLENGNIVKSEDVREPSLPGVNIIAIECPSEDHLDSILHEKLFDKYYSGENMAAAVIHFTGVKILKHNKYQEWIKRFSGDTKHIFINEDNKPVFLHSTFKHQFKLNFLTPKLFPYPYLQDIPVGKNFSVDGHILTNYKSEFNPNEVFYKCEKNFFIQGDDLCKVYLRPKLGFDYSKRYLMEYEDYLNEVSEEVNLEEIKSLKKALESSDEKLELNKRIYPKVTFLGTGSSKASRTRNASGILLSCNEFQNILFDCGENTVNQMVALYGKEKTQQILMKIDAIFISHMHIDHHLGLISILINRKFAFDEFNKSQKMENRKNFEPVYILGPTQMEELLNSFIKNVEDISGFFKFISNHTLTRLKKKLQQEELLCIKKLNMEEIRTTLVCHSPNSFGITVTHLDKWKITYSGDTKPCASLVNIGKKSDLLIHEATLQDTFVKEAIAKKHSTVGQALEVAKRMRAKNILLTHFSQRYAVLPFLEEENKAFRFGIAYDLMEVPFNKLPLLPLLIEPLHSLFKRQYQILWESKRILMLTQTKKNV